MRIKPQTLVLDRTDLFVIAEALEYIQTNNKDRAENAHAELIKCIDAVTRGEMAIEVNPTSQLLGTV